MGTSLVGGRGAAVNKAKSLPLRGLHSRGKDLDHQQIIQDKGKGFKKKTKTQTETAR